MSTSIFGNLSVLVPTDTPFHGTGKIETQESFYLTRSSGIAKLEATNAAVPLSVQAANALTVASSANSVTLTGQTGFSGTANTGNVSLTALAAGGAVNVAAGSTGTVLMSGQTLQLGPTSGTTSAVNIQTAAAANANYTSMAFSATGLHATTKQDVSLVSTKANGSLVLETGTASADTHAKLNVFHDAGNSEAGLIELTTSTGAGEGKLRMTKNSVELVAGTVTLGKVGSNVNIAGDLTIAGTQTVVNSTNVTISDRIMNLGVMPAATSDSGFIFERYATDVTSQAAVSSTTLATNSSAGATSVSVTSASGMANGQLLRIVGATTEHVMITNVAGAVITVTPALVAGFAAGNAVTTYTKRASALFFDESAAEFAVAYTTAVPSDTSIGVTAGEYANLHVNNLTVDGGFNSASFRTLQVTVAANAAVGAAVLIAADLTTRGSYIIVVQSTDANGASAVFSISKGQASLSGAATAVLSSSPASAGQDEQVKLSWPASSTGPRLYHQPLRTGSPSTQLQYSVRIMSV